MVWSSCPRPQLPPPGPATGDPGLRVWKNPKPPSDFCQEIRKKNRDGGKHGPVSGFCKNRNRQAIFVKKFDFFFVDFFFKLFDKNRLAVSGFGLLDKNRLAVCLEVLDFLAFFRRFFDFFRNFLISPPDPSFSDKNLLGAGDGRRNHGSLFRSQKQKKK